MQKNLSVANKLLKHARIPLTARAKYKIPLSREVQIINKWKSLYMADRELAQTRRHYKVKISDRPTFIIPFYPFLPLSNLSDIILNIIQYMLGWVAFD